MVAQLHVSHIVECIFSNEKIHVYLKFYLDSFSQLMMKLSSPIQKYMLTNGFWKYASYIRMLTFYYQYYNDHNKAINSTMTA